MPWLGEQSSQFQRPPLPRRREEREPAPYLIRGEGECVRNSLYSLHLNPLPPGEKELYSLPLNDAIAQ